MFRDFDLWVGVNKEQTCFFLFLDPQQAHKSETLGNLQFIEKSWSLQASEVTGNAVTEM